ncbi:MAG: RNA polymerase sigma factor [Alloalcanivorax venustensis]|uniref:RNA polymerase sigma factor n=1 Tax=Alloalcanivorax venustensis TaxID=172371 RepID=UPI003298360F
MSRHIEALYREESRRVLATLIRLLGDFDLAEEALQDAFAAAVTQWPVDGVPDNPRAWLISAGRFKAIDRLRRRARFDASLEELALRFEQAAEMPDLDLSVEDDRLRLIFTCCHPALSEQARVALTLREVCDLTTEEIASAFLTPTPTVAQRIVRAKAKIRDAGIPYRVPEKSELAERLDSVLQVIYLVFNEGYFPSSGDAPTRADLSSEALRLGRLLLSLLPEPEVAGLVALMLLTEARRAARTDAAGDPVLLDDQDRALWDRALIAEGERLVEQALRSRRFGPYSLQAAIAAVHAEAPRPEHTDWEQIVGLYDVLLRAAPSPVIALNRAVAVAMRDGPEAGLALIDGLLADGGLDGYYLAQAARADLCRRAGRIEEARAAYRAALALCQQGAQRAFLEKRLAALDVETRAP